jgi:hypothetical protein
MSHRHVMAVAVVLACMATGADWAAAAVPGGAPAAAPAQKTPGTLDAVTVYRGQALVSRLVDVPGPAGLKEVTVTGLPEQILPGSLYAEAAGGAEVQSVNYSAQPVETDVRADVQKFDEQIRELQDQVSNLQMHRQALDAQREMLNRVSAFSVTTSATDLNKGVLNPDTLQKMVQFDFEQQKRILEEQLKLDKDIRATSEQLQTVQRQRSQVATSSSKIAREARLLVNLTANGGKVRLRYLVNNATWSPSYNLRVDAPPAAGGERKATLEYLASIQQMSGEDWSNVKMTLSTASPSLLAKAPLLNELDISLATPGRTDVVDLVQRLDQNGGREAAQYQLQQQRAAIEQVRATIGSSAPGRNVNNVNIQGNVVNIDYIGDNNDVDLLLNKTAGDSQLVDLAAKDKVLRVKEVRQAQIDNEMAITYQLNGQTSLLSRSDRQLIRIANISLKPRFYKVAQPVLNDYVYDEAVAVNESPYVLLYGDLQTFVDSQFVGRGVIYSTAKGQNLEMGLGIDTSLRAHRALVEKTEGIDGGNRVAEFTYRCSIENYGSAPVKVQLYDRLPQTKNTAKEINITMGTSAKGSGESALGAREPLEKAMSQDPQYLQKDRKMNVLRWDLDVPANSVDDKAYTVEYQFTLSYDKNLIIATPAPRVATGAPAAPASLQPGEGQGGGGFGGGAGGGAGGGGRGGRGGTIGR